MRPEEIKRFHDIWRGDPDFRQEFLERPRETLLNWDLSQKGMALHSFCVEQQAKGNLRLSGLEDLPEAEAYRAVLRQRESWLDKQYYSFEFGDSTFTSWRLRQVGRFRTQVPGAWAQRNPHLPFAVELTNGCSLGCRFCAGVTQRLDPDIPAFAENRDFFVGLLRSLQQTVGLQQVRGPLYFYTEPFDHPEYEQYLAEAGRILGVIPQTTTAAWFKDPPRIRRFLKQTAEAGMPYNRFSVNSRKLFRQCLNHYSPRELLPIRLIFNYPEAAAPPLCSLGRGRQLENTVLGSVACVTGFLINLPLRRIRLVSPTLEVQRWPLGYRIVEEASIATLDDLERFLQHCRQARFNQVLQGDSPLELRGDLHLEQQEDRWALVNSYRRVPLTDGERSMVEHLPAAKTVNELLRHKIPGLTPNQVFARLQTWWANGLLED